MDLCQEQAAFGALDDAVIVGARERNGLADAELRQCAGGHRLIFGRIFDRTGRDDRTLAGHQTRVRGDGADRAGIGQRDSRSLKIGDLELAVAGLFDLLVIGGEKLRRNSSRSPPLIFGTSRFREPSFFSISIAMPRLTFCVFEPRGTPLTTPKPTFRCG